MRLVWKFNRFYAARYRIFNVRSEKRKPNKYIEMNELKPENRFITGCEFAYNYETASFKRFILNLAARRRFFGIEKPGELLAQLPSR